MSGNKRSYGKMSTAQLLKKARRYETAQGPRMKSVRMISKETGYVDVAITTYGLDTTGSITLLNTVPQGAAVTQRVGKKIQLKSIQCRGKITGRSDAVVNDVAYMIVYDKRPQSSLPAITDILNTIDPASQNNDANSGRFQIIKRVDEVLIGGTSLTGAVANTLTEATSKNADWFCSLKGLPTVYKAVASGAIGDIEEGALYLVTLGDQASGTPAAQLRCSFRVRFLDV